MKYVHAVLAFVFMFVVAFLVGGFILRRIVPQGPDTVFNPFAAAHWSDNWEGLVCGVVAGVLYVRGVLRQYEVGKDKAAGE